MKFHLFAAGAALALCAPSLFAQQLNRVQVMALQQQLRDDGCGVAHVTGTVDAPTRKAINQCGSKYNVTTTNPATMLSAMNIGFSPGDNQPSLSQARENGMSDTTGAAMKQTGRHWKGHGRMHNGTKTRTHVDSTKSTPSTPPVSTPTPPTNPQ